VVDTPGNGGRRLRSLDRERIGYGSAQQHQRRLYFLLGGWRQFETDVLSVHDERRRLLGQQSSSHGDLHRERRKLRFNVGTEFRFTQCSNAYRVPRCRDGAMARIRQFYWKCSRVPASAQRHARDYIHSLGNPTRWRELPIRANNHQRYCYLHNSQWHDTNLPSQFGTRHNLSLHRDIKRRRIRFALSSVAGH